LRAATASLSVEQRPRVLYCSYSSLTQPHLIAEWWIEQAGGQSVTKDGRVGESVTFSLEHMLAWNPQVIFVTNPKEIDALLAEPRLRDLAAVRDHRIFAIPNGAHLWGNRTIEQPLTLLWAAKILHPALLPDLDIAQETKAFYSRFFSVTLDAVQINDILAGTPAP